MKRILTAVILILPIALLVVANAYGVNWITSCSFSHTNNDDVIVFPGQPGASHNHTYVGARSNNASSTVQSMQASGTTCAMAGDTSGYWVPSSQYSVHTSKGYLFYYTGSPNVRAFPPGLRMIVRWTTPGNRILFKCGPGSNPETRVPPASCSSGMFVPVVTFPNWSDGRLDSPDHLSHMSYSRDATHTIELPRIKAYARTAVPAGQPINSSFSSGDYTTYHMDFFNAWNASELQRFIDMCMKTGRNCGTNPQ
jgi:uncharacterized protein DUF1996